MKKNGRMKADTAALEQIEVNKEELRAYQGVWDDRGRKVWKGYIK